jgi:hypothetical protein
MIAMEANSNLMKCLDAFRKKKTSGGFYPVYYGIETSRFCNFACIMCPHPSYRQDEKGNMSWRLYTAIIDQIAPYAEIIKLHWIGEPLIHPRIVEMIAYARRVTKAELQLSTNGALLQGALAEQIRTSGLDKIIFSLDGNSAQTYESIRINGNFEQVVFNIQSFVETVERKGGPVSKIKLIQFKKNTAEVYAFRDKWDRYKSVIVSIMWLSTWAGQLPDLEAQSNNLSPYASSGRQACADLWFKMQVNWLGEVNLCCFDWSGQVTIGNLHNQSVFDVWQGEKIVAERQRHLEERYQGMCAPCTEWAKVQEYEFWYDYHQLKKDSSVVWKSKGVPGLNQQNQKDLKPY